MSRTWSFVDELTGKPTGQTFSGPEHALAANTPPGCRAIPGMLEHVRRDDPELRRSRTIQRIEVLERRQLRPIRELQLDPTNDDARRRLDEIEQEIQQLRATL